MKTQQDKLIRVYMNMNTRNEKEELKFELEKLHLFNEVLLRRAYKMKISESATIEQLI